MKGGSFLGTVISPRATFARMAGAPAKEGAVPVVVAGLGWAALSLVLAANGEAPSRPAPLIAGELHYAAQAAFVVPLFVVSWLVLSFVAGKIVRTDARAALGYAYGVPLLLTWALPDAVALGAFGFDALTKIVLAVAPLTSIYTLVLATIAIRASSDASTGRAFAAALAGLVAQALVGSWLLR